mmetsp:Transcript_147885/g.474778  ORF Transcript_147885/g.474778 Transcript_147885/m.474778 type:complete len:390 (-) Transcript_147885:623-1792(-)
MFFGPRRKEPHALESGLVVGRDHVDLRHDATPSRHWIEGSKADGRVYNNAVLLLLINVEPPVGEAPHVLHHQTCVDRRVESERPRGVEQVQGAVRKATTVGVSNAHGPLEHLGPDHARLLVQHELPGRHGARGEIHHEGTAEVHGDLLGPVKKVLIPHELMRSPISLKDPPRHLRRFSAQQCLFGQQPPQCNLQFRGLATVHPTVQVHAVGLVKLDPPGGADGVHEAHRQARLVLFSRVVLPARTNGAELPTILQPSIGVLGDGRRIAWQAGRVQVELGTEKHGSAQGLEHPREISSAAQPHRVPGVDVHHQPIPLTPSSEVRHIRQQVSLRREKLELPRLVARRPQETQRRVRRERPLQHVRLLRQIRASHEVSDTSKAGTLQRILVQ